METKHKDIFHQALVNMGYRQMNETIYGKPIGFGIIIVEIKNDDAKFKTMFYDAKQQVNVWGSSSLNIKDNPDNLEGEELYKKFTSNIAYKEFEAHTEEILFPLNGELSKTFDFR